MTQSSSGPQTKPRSGFKEKTTPPKSGVSRSNSGASASSAGGALRGAGSAVGDAAKKIKTPALAGGAALAGLAGGLALASRAGGPRRVLGVPIPGTHKPLVTIKSPRGQSASKNLLKAAEELGSAGRSVSDLLAEIDRVRGALDGGGRRSPIEVVLQGLTSRGRDTRAG